MSVAVTPQPNVLGPTLANERIQIIDVLRGWALFGILMVNMEFFSYPVGYMFQNHQWPDRADWVADALMKILAQGKFYTLFSFLFGLGFSIIMLRGEQRGVKATGFAFRRFLVLLGIGLVHALLIWMGDILVVYSLMGFVMLWLFRNRKPKTLLIWAFTLLVGPMLFMGLGVAAAKFSPEAAKQMHEDGAKNKAKFEKMTQDALAQYPSRDWRQVQDIRMREWGSMWTWALFWFPGVLAMFLIGLYAGKRDLLRNAAEHKGLFKKVLWFGVLFGLPASVASFWLMQGADMAVPTPKMWAAMSLSAFANPALGFAYASIFVLLSLNEKVRSKLAPMAALGRMALTNYLTQSIVMTLIFYGYGLGLYAKYGPAVLLPMVPVFWLLQIPISMWWLKRFQFGPAEWLWRSLTYGKAQPMKIGSAGV